MVASIADDFNGYTVGTNLGALADYTVVQVSGSGVPRIDTHNDHSDGSNVVDVSAPGTAWWVRVDQLDSVDHKATIDVWPDRDFDGDNGMCIAVRMQTATPSTTSDITCYLAKCTPDATDIFAVLLYRVIDGTATEIASASPVGPVWGPNVSAFPLELEVSTNGSGNVDLIVTVDGVEEIALEDSNVARVTTGSFIGGRTDRPEGSVDGQPIFDNLLAEVLAGGQTLDGGAASVEVALGNATPLVGSPSTIDGGTATLEVVAGTATPLIGSTASVEGGATSIEVIAGSAAPLTGTSTTLDGGIAQLELVAGVAEPLTGVGAFLDGGTAIVELTAGTANPLTPAGFLDGGVGVFEVVWGAADPLVGTPAGLNGGGALLEVVAGSVIVFRQGGVVVVDPLTVQDITPGRTITDETPGRTVADEVSARTVEEVFSQ